MKIMPARQARNRMRDLLDTAIAGEPTVLTRNGRPVAIVVPAAFLPIGRAFPADDKQAEPV